MIQQRIAVTLARSRTVRAVVVIVAVSVLLLPVLAAGGVAGLLAEEDAKAQCASTGGEVTGEPAAGGQVAAGMFAAPLQLQRGRWYEVGATEYGGPSDPSSGDYGAIPDPTQSYLPAHPDSFAELSLLDHNPANGGTFTFTDANALDRLPYLSGLRVRHDARELVLLKRDVGYGQGPGERIGNGEPYRLDVWWQAAETLAITKSAVNIQLAPASGSAATLEALPHSHEALPGGTAGVCRIGPGASDGPQPLTAGTQTKIMPDGLAAAGREAPKAVKEMVAAGNRISGTAYLYGGGHGVPLSEIQPAYDCSSAVSYLLYSAGLLKGEYAQDSTQLASYGDPGPGRYVSIYANAAHAFIFVAGLRFDTVEDPAYDEGPNAGKPGPRWRVYPGVPDWASWTVRHPPGL
jgi:hypothetical protein